MIVILTLAALLCAGGAFGDDEYGAFSPGVSRHLTTIPSIGAIKASCRTKASVTLSLTRGRARGRARSSCIAFAASINNVEKVVEEYLENMRNKPKKFCTTVKIEEVIQTCAKAIAKAYTDAAVSIRVRGGDARVCASARSEGDAYAQGYAALWVNLWLGTTTGENSAEAEAKAETLTLALSKAWAEAKTSRCQKGRGQVRDFQVSYASQVRVAITCVTVQLVTKLCDVHLKKQVDSGECTECSNGELEGLLKATESSSDVTACSRTVTLEDKTIGDAKTEDRDAVKCSGKREKCCGADYDGASECLCGRNCFLKRTVSGLWLNSKSNKLCYCPNYDVLPFDGSLDK